MLNIPVILIKTYVDGFNIAIRKMSLIQYANSFTEVNFTLREEF